jgi:L-asparaginase
VQHDPVAAERFAAAPRGRLVACPSKSMTKRPRVLLAHTGGTLGMRRRADGRYAPAPGALAEALAGLPELRDPALPKIELLEFDPLLDSSDMRPQDWQRVADAVEEHAGGVDGVVVLHGTDTMAYTASALSFMLAGLPFPVVLTGSQVPLGEVRTDARENLLTSLLLATTPFLREVVVYLGGSVLRGNRCTKVSASGFDAFASPNLPPLAEVGVDIVWRRELLRPSPPGPLQVRRLRDVGVVALRLFPGITGTTLRQVLQAPVRGLVLESYGSGNAPTRDPDLIDALADAWERGVVTVNVSQCLRGTVDMDAYAAAGPLQRAGVVSGGDMTAEAALTKLYVLISQDLPPGEVARLMLHDLAGERSD